MDLHSEMANTRLGDGEIALFWLGQAGFAIKDQSDTLVVIDPYLTDCGERLKPDIFIATHTHFDHFDTDAMPLIAANPETRFYGPKSCYDKWLSIGIKEDRVELLEPEFAVRHKDICMRGAYADHGTLAPDAIGLLIELQGIRLYFSGDTAYRPEKWEDVYHFKPHICVLSVNGKYGNLTPAGGALIARDTGAKLAIPCHFWTFREHGGNPQLFEEEMRLKAPECKVQFMYQGERLKYTISN